MPPKDGEKLKKRKSKIKKAAGLISAGNSLDTNVLNAAMGVLNTEIDAFKHKPLDKEDVASLMQTYKMCIGQIVTFLKEKTDISPETGESLEKVKRSLSKDMRVLYHYEKKLKSATEEAPAPKLTFNELLETSRSRRIEVDSENVGRAGAGQHVRAVIPTENGKVYFTESVKVDSFADERKKLIDTYKQRFGAEADFLDQKDFKNVLEFIYLFGNKNVLKYRAGHEDSKTIVSNFRDLMRAEMEKASKLKLKIKILGRTLDDNAPDILDSLDTLRKRKIFLSCLNDYQSMRLATHMNSTQGIHAGCYQDKRNSAMSFMAEELGMGDLLAHSENVHITFNDKGKKTTVKGTAMNAARGEDLNRVGSDSNMIKVSLSSFENPGLIKQVASLQVLDYICGNGDRHLANFMYQIDADGNVTGIQGFDNDSSFGSLYMTNGAGGKKVPPEDFRIIPESVAEGIMNMDAESMKFMLHGFDLDAKEIDAALARLSNMKSIISDSRAKYAEEKVPEGELLKFIPRVVKDEDLGKYSFAKDLAKYEERDKKKYGNLFGVIANTFKDGRAVNEVISTQSAIINKCADSIVNDYWSGAEDIVRNMKIQNPKRAFGSKQYDDMLEEAEKLEVMLEKIEGPLIGEAYNRDTNQKVLHFVSESDKLKEKVRKVNELTEKYLNERAIPRRAAQKSKSSRAFKRYALAMKLKEMTDGILKKYQTMDQSHWDIEELRAKSGALKAAAREKDKEYYKKQRQSEPVAPRNPKI